MTIKPLSTTNDSGKTGYLGKPIADFISNGFFTVDQHWTVKYWNKAAEKLLGVPAADIIGKNLGEYPAIHIHTIAPAFINTAHLKHMIQKETAGGIKLFPVDRQGTIQEVAGLILWLSSDETQLLSTVADDTN